MDMSLPPTSYVSSHMTLIGVPGVPVFVDVQSFDGGQVLDDGQVPGRRPYPVKDCGGWIWILVHGDVIQFPAPSDNVELLGDQALVCAFSRALLMMCS